MDFLLEADKKNRRRVRLENLLLLLLRCLIVLLIGLLLARPFKPLGVMAGLLETEGYERIVLLDNSLSMGVREGSRTSLDNAKASLVDFVRSLSSDSSKDYLTLYVTSRPHAAALEQPAARRELCRRNHCRRAGPGEAVRLAGQRRRRRC